MENAADALKIAFTMFIFVIAITITFTFISQAKSTSDAVLYHSDETNFYEYSSSRDENREVSVVEIIPTLYRYYEESIGVTIKLKNGEIYTFDLNNNKQSILLDDKKELNSKAEIETNLEKFVNVVLLGFPENTKFTEEFVEIPITGIYEYGSDGTELQISSGGKKVYITYIEK